MNALVLSAANDLHFRSVPSPAAGPGEVLVKLHASALNHRDVWIKLGQYAGLKFPVIPGSDGAGVVAAVGPGAASDAVGREVVINPALGWGDRSEAQGDGFTILGLPRDGTHAEEVSVPVENVKPKPPHLSWEEAGALPLAGLTAYRALFTRAKLKSGEKVLISGIGGGVALFALQFAVAAGAEAWVTSSSSDKLSRARRLGAAGGASYPALNWATDLLRTAGSFDVIVDGAGGPGLNELIDLASPGARLVTYGATRGNPPELAWRKVFWRQLNLLGSTMGSPAEFEAMLAFVTQHRIRPTISEVFSLEQGVAAFALMERGGQFGKIVLGR
jgi:NADPH:quinone reductase-like Zn-dependent oxidoreductase